MAKAFRIAIMDAVPKIYWGEDEGFTDGEKFRDLLQPLNLDAQIDIYYAAEKELPASIGAYDAYLIGGSPASVNDDFDWIARLVDLVLDADSRRKRIVACCFGHQLVAKSFGGAVEHNESGWLIGNYQLEILRDYDWMQPPATRTGLYHFNKERVTRLPTGALSFARSEDYADFAYTLGNNILCLQGHPEQPLRAMNNFLASVASEIPRGELSRARKMIDNGVPDADIWGRWMMGFFLS